MCTYSCNQLCEKLHYYSYGHVLVQLIVRRIRKMIVHMRILFIVLDCMNSCTSDCFYEHPPANPSSGISLGFRLYFIVYPSSRHNTDTEKETLPSAFGSSLGLCPRELPQAEGYIRPFIPLLVLIRIRYSTLQCCAVA